MSDNPIPVIDLDLWRAGDDSARARLGREVDTALIDSGFLLIKNHGVDPALRSAIRDRSKEFFALPADQKAHYATFVGGRGWIPPGREANGYLENVALPADLKETFTSGFQHSTGDPVVDTEWFTPNVWPTEVPTLETLCNSYSHTMRGLADEILRMLAMSFGIDEDWFAARCSSSPHAFNISRYPALHLTGPVEEGQYRIAPHTDFGTITILDREAGYGGLQVCTRSGEWIDAPVVEDTFTINIGDLMARWTGDRWASTRHRVLPPSPEAPDEELVSLIFFFEADLDQVIEAFPPPFGRANSYEPVTTADYLRGRYQAITVP